MLRCPLRRIVSVGFWHASKHSGMLRTTRWMSSDSIEARLKKHFQKVMKCEHIPLLSDFDVYSRSLPVRESNGVVTPLYTVPYWTSDEDLEGLAYQLEAKSTIERSCVKYICAPTGYGKTACILPGFLKSTEQEGGFTHYLYMAFSNNNHNYFRSDGFDNGSYISPRFFEQQSAIFILKCLESGSFTNVVDKLKNTLRNIKRPDQQRLRILLHLDEHRKMCDRVKPDDDNVCSGAKFSKGALEALAKFPDVVTVIATHIEHPPLPSSQSSEACCRSPVVMPGLYIKATMKAIPELYFPHPPGDFDRRLGRMWATLVLRLAIKLRECGLINLHTSEKNEDLTELLQNFKRGASLKKAEDALKSCLQACKISINYERDPDPNAVELLLGMTEDKLQTLHRQVPRLAYMAKTVTASLEYLLTTDDPEYDVYSQGQERFRALLSKDDYLSQAPLEAAYHWSLSCTSAMHGNLELRDDLGVFVIKCEQLLPGRLFEGQDNTMYDRKFEEVKRNVIYYAKEREDKCPTHPLADMFFRTESELVLLDFTGGNDRVVEDKAEKLSKWIKQEQPKVNKVNKENKENGLILHGVVLAPLATSKIKIKAQHVHILSGEDGKQHMGGLRQILRWME